MRLAVVTVNYCCANEIIRRLEDTASQVAACDGEWWIVDNKSPDDSAESLAAATARFKNVHLIVTEKNGGFGYGNNQVINHILSGEIDADYVYFLNPDAAPLQGAIEAMMAYLDEHPDVGAVGSGLVNEDGSHTDSMFRFPSLWSEIDYALAFGPASRLLLRHRQSLGELDVPGPVDWVAGTSFMVRSKVLCTVGGFDESFFLYWEEVELCHRIKKAGFAIHGVPGAKVRHVGGVSTNMHRNDRRMPAYWHRSRNLYFRTTRSGGPLILLNALVALSLAVRRTIQVVRRMPITHPHFLRDHIKHALEDSR